MIYLVKIFYSFFGVSMTQEIVVYRNPMEKAFWDFIMSADGFVFILVFLVYISSVVILFKLAENGKIRRRFSRNRFAESGKKNKNLISCIINLVDRYPSVVFIFSALPAYVVYSLVKI